MRNGNGNKVAGIKKRGWDGNNKGKGKSGESNGNRIRECENIRNGYLYDGDLVFVILKGIYGFEFPKRFFGDLFQRSHFFSSSFFF
jgi:hypothetical protein